MKYNEQDVYLMISHSKLKCISNSAQLSMIKMLWKWWWGGGGGEAQKSEMGGREGEVNEYNISTMLALGIWRKKSLDKK